MNRALWKTLILALTCVSGARALGDEPPPGADRSHTLTREPDTGRWIQEAPPSAGTPEGDLYGIRERLKAQDFRRALSAIKAWEKAYGSSDALLPQVRLLRTQAMIGRRDYFKAHNLLTEFLNEHGGTEWTHEALRQEFVIAEVFLSGTKRKFWGVRMLSGDDIALQILDDISTNYPADELASMAIKTKGDYFERIGEHSLAEIEYVRLLTEYPDSRYYAYALRRAADAAMAAFAGVEFDEAPLIEAQARYEQYARRYPRQAKQGGVDAILATIRERRAMKELGTGEYYERTDHLKSAVFMYENVVDRWEGTVAAARARARLAILGAAPGTEAPGSAVEQEG